MENLDQILDSPAAEQKKFPYAGFWIRVVAYLIDGILLAVINFIIGLVMGSAGTGAGTMGSVISLIIGLVYFSVMESSESQGTVGKMVVNIKVGDSNGERISLSNAMGRWLAKILSAILLCIGFMMVGWDDKKQGLHDKLADTYVFYK